MGKIFLKKTNSFIMVNYLKTKAEFDEAMKSAKLVVVDFTASWCPPCNFIAPKFEAMAGENPDVDFFKVDVDENSETSTACGINCMPTFKLYKNGAELTKMEGANEAKAKELAGD